MKIVVKSIDNEEGDFLVYLKTDDDVSVHAEFATLETLDYVKNELAEGDNTIPVFMDIEKKDLKVDFGVNDNLPLVLVFYLDRELMGNKEMKTVGTEIESSELSLFRGGIGQAVSGCAGFGHQHGLRRSMGHCELVRGIDGRRNRAIQRCGKPLQQSSLIAGNVIVCQCDGGTGLDQPGLSQWLQET